MITFDDYVLLVDRTLGFTEKALARLDDRTVNLRPDLDAANSPYGIVTHMLAAFDFWTQHIICGHPTDRDRPREFVAQGPVADLVAATTSTRNRLQALGPELVTANELSHVPTPESPLNGEWTVGTALLHAYEELAQHLGHLELTVDVLLKNHDAN